jgi:hypothetical protein
MMRFTIVLPVFNLQCDAGKDNLGIGEVQSAFSQGGFALVDQQIPAVIVSTTNLPL